MARQEIKRGKKEEDRIEREREKDVWWRPEGERRTRQYSNHGLLHIPVSRSPASPFPSSSSHLRASQPVQPNLSSWQDTSVRTSSGPPQSTNSIAIHVAPDHVTTALLRIPATNFQCPYQPTFSLYPSFLFTLLSFPFSRMEKAGVGGSRSYVVSKERRRGNGRSVENDNDPDTNERWFSADRRGWIGPIFASNWVFTEKHVERNRDSWQGAS